MDKLIDQVNNWIAHTSVGPSTVRGQRSPGLVDRLRKLLIRVDLQSFAKCQKADFLNLLNVETETIKRQMPRGKQHWGIARKVLNIYLRGAMYNAFLRKEYKLNQIESCLELPLDSLTANGVKKRSPKRSLPTWTGVKNLSEHDSRRFQERAQTIADEMGIHRIHLDIYLWLDR